MSNNPFDYEDDPTYNELVAGSLLTVVLSSGIIGVIVYVAAKAMGY